MNQIFWSQAIAEFEPAEEYHGREGLSGSKLKDLMRPSGSPELFYRKHIAKVAQQSTTDAMEFGTSIHEDVLTGAVQRGWKVIPKEVLTKNGAKNGNAWRDFKAANAGKVLLKEQDVERMMNCMEAIRNNPTALDAISAYDTEESTPTQMSTEITMISEVSWVDEDGLPHTAPMRGRFDYLKPETIVDLKTTYDLSIDRFPKKARYEMRYDVQASIYRKLAELYDGRRRDVLFVVVETREPFRCDVYEPENLDETDRFVESAIVEYFKRRATGDWNRDYFGEILVF